MVGRSSILCGVTLLVGCSFGSVSLEKGPNFADINTNLCDGPLNSPCWSPDAPIAVGSSWKVWEGEGSGEWFSDGDGLKTIDLGGGVYRFKTIESGLNSVRWSSGSWSESYDVDARWVHGLDVTEVMFTNLSLIFQETFDYDIVSGALPDPPGDLIRIQEGGYVLFDMHAVDSNGESLWLPGRSIAFGEKKNPCPDWLCLESSHPFSGMVLAGETIHPLEVESAQASEIERIELLIFHRDYRVLVHPIAFDSSGERIWAPEITWLVHPEFDISVDRTDAILDWNGEEGEQPLTFVASAGDVSVSETVTISMASQE